MFGKLMSISDDLMMRYYELLTDITPDALARLKDDLASGAQHPRQVKEDLAKEIVARYHSQAAADHEAQEFIRVLRERELPEEIEAVTLTISEPNLWLARLMVDAGLAAGTSEARRLITQGGVQVEGEKVTDANLALEAGKTYLLKVGKRRFKRVTLAGS
jgi:tyrosyl-tRNA synthetase